MMGFVLGAAVGYVLGARAGRERYDQLVRAYHRVAEHPAVQSAAGVAREKVTDVARSYRDGRDGHGNGTAAPAHGVVPDAHGSVQPVSAIPRA